MSKKAEQNPHHYHLGKACLILGLTACVLLVIFWLWIYRFHKYYPGGGLNPPILNDIWNTMFGISVFTTPPVAIMVLLCGIIGIRQGREKYKRQALFGALISMLMLVLYSLYFISVLF